MQELVLGNRHVRCHEICDPEGDARGAESGAEMVLAGGTGGLDEHVGAHADKGAGVQEDKGWEVEGEHSLGLESGDVVP